MLEYHLVLEGEKGNAPRVQGATDCRIPVDRQRFIVVIGEYGVCTEFEREGRNGGTRLVVEDNQAAAGIFQLRLEFDDRFADEFHPAVGPGRQRVQDFPVEHEYAIHAHARFKGAKQRRVIVHAQVAAKPHQ